MLRGRSRAVSDAVLTLAAARRAAAGTRDISYTARLQRSRARAIFRSDVRAGMVARAHERGHDFKTLAHLRSRGRGHHVSSQKRMRCCIASCHRGSKRLCYPDILSCGGHHTHTRLTWVSLAPKSFSIRARAVLGCGHSRRQRTARQAPRPPRHLHRPGRASHYSRSNAGLARTISAGYR